MNFLWLVHRPYKSEECNIFAWKFKERDMTQAVDKYTPKNKIRIVTAASLFDGHDASINIMRRIIQATGAEVIHLGHNRSVQEVVDCAIQEDAQGIALTSYQGGHVEYFKYMFDLLKERGAGHIKIFGGGGGVILPSEIEELHTYGITKIFSPDDGRELGLQGMINSLVEACDYQTIQTLNGELKYIEKKDPKAIGQTISMMENHPEESAGMLAQIKNDITHQAKIPVIGITGTGGAGKSSLVDELVRRFLLEFKDKTMAIISVDPSKRKTGGALLGDRIRMNAINNPRVYMRSMATRQSNLALSKYVQESIDICKAAAFDLIIVETSGIGQSDTEITDHCDVSLYVMTPEFGAASQLEKIDMLDFADMVAINKFDKKGSLDALRDVKKQYKRNHQLFEAKDEDLPIYGTIAAQFNDPGMNRLYRSLMNRVADKLALESFRSNFPVSEDESQKIFLIPSHRVRYLAEITEASAQYNEWVNEQATIASKLYKLKGVIDMLKQKGNE
jgi:methylmalonyl-CoA mutase